MKTIKFIFSLLVSLVLVAPAFAEDEPLAFLYAEDINAVLGEEVELPIVLKNSIPVKSIQFNIEIPEGVSFVTGTGGNYKYTKVNSNLEGWIFTAKTDGGQSVQTAIIMGYDQNGSNLLPIGEETFITLTLKVAKNANLENAKIVLSNQKFTKEDGTQFRPYAEGVTSSSSITGTSYAEGYFLEIIPFKTSASAKETIVLNMNCATEDITAIEFDLTMPKILTRTKEEGKRTSLAPGYADESRMSNEDHSITMTDYHVSIQPKVEDDLRMIAGTKGPLVFLYYTTASSATEGVYQLSISNIKMTQDGISTALNIAPYTADIYVGTTTPVATPDANGVVAFHGNYSTEAPMALMNAALKSNAITTIDLSAVNAIGAIGPQNKNAIISAPAALSTDLASTNNVVIDGKCANLVLTDGYPFANTEKFTATSASYSRTMTDNTWGTLCLPFAATATNASVYNLTSVGSGEMKYEEASTPTAVSANTPCVIKKSSDEISFSASSVEVPATPETITAETSVSGWTLYGTTVDVNFTSSELGNIYFINGDAFWKASGSLHVAPFRAYFTGSGSGAKFRIEEETNGIEAISAEAETGVIYDLQGRTVKAPQAGQFYIQGSKKYIVK